MRTVTRGRQPAGAGPPLRSGPLGDCRGRPCGKLVAGQLGSWPVFHRRNRGAGGAACLLVSPLWTDFGRSTPWRPGWERRGWRWSDREPLGSTGPERSLVATVFSYDLNGYTSVRARKTSTGAGKDARFYRRAACKTPGGLGLGAVLSSLGEHDCPGSPTGYLVGITGGTPEVEVGYFDVFSTARWDTRG